jgi:capsular polysaccharide biosynthesis protein
LLSDKFKSLVKDVLLVSLVFVSISGAYYGFAVAERYRALTQAYIAQSEQLIKVLQNQGSGNAQETQPN